MKQVRAELKGEGGENRRRCTGRNNMKSDSRKPEGAHRIMQELSLEDKPLAKADWGIWTSFGLKQEAIKVLWEVRICFKTIDQVLEMKSDL